MASNERCYKLKIPKAVEVIVRKSKEVVNNYCKEVKGMLSDELVKRYSNVSDLVLF